MHRSKAYPRCSPLGSAGGAGDAEGATRIKNIEAAVDVLASR